MKYGEYKVHDDRLSEAIGQIKDNMRCGSETSGLILTRNTINPLGLGFMMYTTLTFLFYAKWKPIVQEEHGKK